MLLRPDLTFIDKATKRPERVFPRGTQWLNFQSRFPSSEVFKNTSLDPAIGIAGELAISTFARADWHNWISSTQIGLYEIGTRIGLPTLKNTSMAKGLSGSFQDSCRMETSRLR